METLGNKLVALRKKFKQTQHDVADRIGISQVTLSHYERDKRRPDTSTLYSLSLYFNVSMEYLLKHPTPAPPDQTSTVEQRADAVNAVPQTLLSGFKPIKSNYHLHRTKLSLQDNCRFYRVGIVGEIAAGPAFPCDDVTPVGYVPVDTALIPNAHRCFCFIVRGDSMHPEIRNGDIVLINPDYDYNEIDHQIVAVQINGENTLKALHVDNEHRQSVFYPINSRRHNPIITNSDTQEDVHILGILVFLIRKYI